MIIDRQSWHWRVYSWWYGHKYHSCRWVVDEDGLEHWQRHSVEPERSNLCPYMRAVMFWAPLRWFFAWGSIWNVIPALWALALVLVALPVFSVHRWDILRAYGMVALTLAFIAGIICGLIALERRRKPLPGIKTLRKFKGSSFWKLLGAYLRSAHDRICPEVEPK